MKIKRTLALLLCIMTLTSFSAYAKTMEFTMGSQEINIKDGEVIESKTVEVAPYTINDRTMVPVRVIMETFGADVLWNEADLGVTITLGEKKIVLHIGQTVATVDGEEVALDVAPVEQNGRTLIPLRFVTEKLGYDVRYVEASEQVIITDDPIVMTVNGIDVSLEEYRTLSKMLTLPEGYTDEDRVQYLNGYFREINTLYSMYLNEGVTALPVEYETVIENVNAAFIHTPTLGLKSVYTDLLFKNAAASSVSNYLFDQVSINEEKIQKFYETYFLGAKHILISSETKDAKRIANDIKTQLNRGADFDKLMIEKTEDPGIEHYPNGYVFTEGEMIPEFENAVKALEIGKVSGVVESEYGYHIIKRIALPPLTEEIRNVCMYNIPYLESDAIVIDLVENAEVKSDYEISDLIEFVK